MGLDEQLNRIRSKLKHVQEKNPQGRDPRELVLQPPLTLSQVEQFESKHGITLPEDFRRFVLEVGSSGFGPAYGLETLDRWFCEADAPDGIQKPAIVQPDLQAEHWWEDFGVDEDERYQGTLYIATHGCTYEILLVLNGPHRGRVVYVDLDEYTRPFFPENQSFVSWYERWLDENLWGYDLDWFGYTVPGTEADLLRMASSAAFPVQRRCDAILSLWRLPSLRSETVQFLVDGLSETEEVALASIQILKNLVRNLVNHFLLPVLSDQRPGVRQEAFSKIIWANKPPGPYTLERRALVTDPATPQQSLDLLQFLKDHLQDPDGKVAATAVTALADLDQPLYSFQELRQSPHPEVRAVYLDQLGHQALQEPYTTDEQQHMWEWMLAGLEDPDAQVRNKAVSGLKTFTHQVDDPEHPPLKEVWRSTSIQRLHEGFTTEPDVEVRKTILFVARYAFDLSGAQTIFLMAAQQPDLATRQAVLSEIDEAFRNGGAKPSDGFRKEPTIHQVLDLLSQGDVVVPEEQALTLQARKLRKRCF
ncbi:SMI1/KNR4 family protein [Deinococcus misasensis]|uniref:SMI1/KNR4 family protein n=1 Tax=Deinococcus misasensis TaxID=392413 RepID=UPI00054FC261|nr:SMI1/KNR4 family protein [Deinococcus misasensis]